MAKVLSLRELFDAYPSSDLLACGPPARDESPSDYEARVEQEGGDTLYLFLVRELTDADELLDVDTAAERVRRAMRDLQAILEAVERGREKDANTAEGQPTYALNIGGPEFRKQRELLQRLQGSAEAQMPYWAATGEAESLEGLINLTDAIADQAHDNHGVDCLLDGYSAVVNEP
jgi:hypothetical protein